MSETREPIVELKGVTKVYEPSSFSPDRLFRKAFDRWRNGSAARLEAAAQLRVHALKGITAEFFAGEFAALAGPSGSGKSTLLNLIGTLDRPTHGDIRILGRRVTPMSGDELADFRLTAMGFVFQAFNLLPVLTALENVEYVLRLQGVAPRQRRERAMEALRQVGLEKLADRRPDHLSGGQQQRVAVARAIIHRPTLVLADEPTANLDSKTAVALLDLMQELNRSQKITFIFSSHDPSVLQRAGRVVHLHDGALASS